MGCGSSTPVGGTAGVAVPPVPTPTVAPPATVEEPAVVGEGTAMVEQETVVDKTESVTATASCVGVGPSKINGVLTLTEKTQLTQDVALYRFELADPDMVLGLRVKSIMVLKALVGDIQEDGTREMVSRPYSPISRPDVLGYVEFAIKEMVGGKMSGHIAKMAIGNTIDATGPILKMEYKANEYAEIGMVDNLRLTRNTHTRTHTHTRRHTHTHTHRWRAAQGSPLCYRLQTKSWRTPSTPPSSLWSSLTTPRRTSCSKNNWINAWRRTQAGCVSTTW
jgi:hypothetical protein